LVDLRPRRGEALGRVGKRLLRGVVGAAEAEHLSAKSFDDATCVGLGIGECRGVALARRPRAEDRQADDGRNDDDDEQK
jgi:hypothetical protein